MILMRRRSMSKEKKINYAYLYLTLEALTEGTFSFNIPSGMASVRSVSYSIDNGISWVTTLREDGTAQTITTPNIKKGESVIWKGEMNRTSDSSSIYCRFTSSCQFDCYGNAMSLLYGDDFKGETAAKETRSFAYLFYSCNGIVSAKNLILPISVLLGEDYSFMFFNATNLIEPPELPSTSLATGCYAQMFRWCKKLSYAPTLPSTILASNCYSFMFYGCSALEKMPHIYATTLATYCCLSMFEGCVMLRKTTPLISSTLAGACYYRMFFGCSNLSEVTLLAKNVSASQALMNWLSGVSENGVFYKAKDSIIPYGASGIPDNWEVIEV